MRLTPSPQQVAFYDWVERGSGSCVLQAVAGSGKTTTVIGGLNLMHGDIFFGAFNKAIALEIKSRAPAKPGLDINTLHAAGFRFWRRAAPKAKVDGTKCRAIFREASARHEQYKKFEGAVLKLVSNAKQSGLGVLDKVNAQTMGQLIDHYSIELPEAADDEDGRQLLIGLATKTLKESIARDHDVVDFDDMIYAPLFHNVSIWQHDWVLIDEAQDTNRTRRELALRMLKKNGRLVAVGDPHQAIYGFTGADANSLELIQKATNAIVLPLSVTYRCPKSVVKCAQQWVSHIQAHETAPDGTVRSDELKNLAKITTPGDAVLCRLTAPLISNVYAFIAAGIPAKVEGREIGEGLKVLASRWKTDSLTQLKTYLDTYLEVESAKLRAKDREGQILALEDKVTCLSVIIGKVQAANRKATVNDLVAGIDALFGDDINRVTSVVFSTIHKSKGREWNRVVWLTTGPSPWARKDWERQQEANLCYVAATRAKNELVLVPAPLVGCRPSD